MSTQLSDIRHSALFLAIENRQSKFEIPNGGIAQLVERQLCKLEVRGSNPLASRPSLGVQRREKVCHAGATRRRNEGGRLDRVSPYQITSPSLGRRDSDPGRA